MKIVYGPIASWRLGRSLGVDLINQSHKICSFDCIYCQLEKKGNISLKRDDIEQAKTFYKRAISIDENYACAYHNLAVAYKKAGDIGNYITNIKKSARIEKRERWRNLIRWKKR